MVYKKFYKDFEKIKNIKKNMVLGYKNINVEKTGEEYIDYVNFQDDNCVSNKLINFCKIDKKLFFENFRS